MRQICLVTQSTKLKVLFLALSAFLDSYTNAYADHLPVDVSDYLQRELACDYFSGEQVSNDNTRNKFLQKAMSELHCENLVWDRETLQQKYLCPAHSGFDCSNPNDNKIMR